MPKPYSSREIIAVLQKHGFRYVSQKGSHVKFRFRNRTAIVPANRTEIPYGTFRSILRQSQLAEEDFEKQF